MITKSWQNLMEYILDISKTVEEQKEKEKRNVELPGVNYGDVRPSTGAR